jgi:hypothetical protein
MTHELGSKNLDHSIIQTNSPVSHSLDSCPPPSLDKILNTGLDREGKENSYGYFLYRTSVQASWQHLDGEWFWSFRSFSQESAKSSRTVHTFQKTMTTLFLWQRCTDYHGNEKCFDFQNNQQSTTKWFWFLIFELIIKIPSNLPYLFVFFT